MYLFCIVVIMSKKREYHYRRPNSKSIKIRKQSKFCLIFGDWFRSSIFGDLTQKNDFLK